MKLHPFANPKSLSMGALFSVATATLASAQAQTPTLWGVNEQYGDLFSIGDYNDAANTLTDFGRLMVDDGGSLEYVGNDIEAFTLDHTGVGWMAINDDLAGFEEPVLLKFDTAQASTTDPNVVTIVGTMDVGFDDSSDNITGLAFHPVTNDLYALFRTGDEGEDRLVILDPANGDMLHDFGDITGLGEKCKHGEDMIFGETPDDLFVTDNDDDHLYRVDANTGAIVEVIDDNQRHGITKHSVKFEALAWDPQNEVLIGCDDNKDLCAILTFGNGNNVFLFDTADIGFVDIEGLAFVPIPFADCDENGVSDADEIAAGAPDHDGNGVPDVCEPDIETFCFGDGQASGSIECPCGNNVVPGATEGCANGTGAGASLTATGSPSIAAADLTLNVTGLPGTPPGVFFAGDGTAANGAGAPFYNGLRCISGPFVRLVKIPMPVNGATSMPVQGQPPVHVQVGANPGDTDYFQFWYRDGGGPCGGSANMSNGLRVTWGL